MVGFPNLVGVVISKKLAVDIIPPLKSAHFLHSYTNFDSPTIINNQDLLSRNVLGFAMRTFLPQRSAIAKEETP